MNTCDYCHAIGACPKCWGRAGIEELKAANARLRTALRAVIGPGPVGYPTPWEMYHDTATCEAPDNCGHCLADQKARAALAGEA